jgi:hypothetical protein
MSVAEWDKKHGFHENKTTDTHYTEEEAKAVCILLEEEGLGGERIWFPEKTYVKEIKL